MPKENNAFVFTHARLEAIKPPQTGRDSYRDAKVAGLSFIITASGSKSFYFVKRIEGKPTRIRIGAYPEIMVDEARKIAQGFTGEIAKGDNPHKARKSKAGGSTLKELFDHWFTTYAKTHKQSWAEDERVFNKYCSKLHKKPLTNLTKADIVKLHKQIGEKHGPYQANRAYRLIRSLFRVADEIGYSGSNPCTGVRQFPEQSRERFLMPDELKKFHDAVMEETSLWRDLNRRFLKNALDFGIHRIGFDPDERTPVVGYGDRKTFVIMPLEGDEPKVEPDKLTVLASDSKPSVPQKVDRPRQRTKSVAEPVAMPSVCKSIKPGDTPRSKVVILEEAEKLRTTLRESLDGVNGLIREIKAQRRQDKLLRDTVASLRKLQGV